MSFRGIMGCVAVFASLSGAAGAEEAATVQSLVKQDFAIVGVFAGHTGGAGVLLQKKDQIFLCLIAETPTSKAVTTGYCKPVE